MEATYWSALRVAVPDVPKVLQSELLAVIAVEELLSVKREYIAKKEIAKNFKSNNIVAE